MSWQGPLPSQLHGDAMDLVVTGLVDDRDALAHRYVAVDGIGDVLVVEVEAVHLLLARHHFDLLAGSEGGDRSEDCLGLRLDSAGRRVGLGLALRLESRTDLLGFVRRLDGSLWRLGRPRRVLF